MRKFLLLITAILFFILLIRDVSAQEKKSAVYFYADWCSHCKKVNAFFKEKGFYEKYNIVKLNYDDKDNRELLEKVFRAKGYKASGVPTIIIGERVLSGDQPIIDNFEKEIEKSETSAVDFVNSIKAGSLKKDSEKTGAVPLSMLVSAALVDAINPCAFAVLIILLATVINARGKNQALLSGLFFTLAVFVSYLLMGLGVYKAITVFNLPAIISIVVGILAIVIGLANLKDAFWHGKAFLMEVPMSWRPKMKEILQKVTSPLGALGAGFLVSLFLLPCTSGPYVVILGLMSQNGGISETLPLLILYNAIFILPMIVITLAMFFGLRMRKLEEWRQENIRLLHAVGGIIMVLIGAYLLKGWI